LADGNTVPWHYIDPSILQQNAFIESFNGSLRDVLLNAELFNNRDDARRKLGLWRTTTIRSDRIPRQRT